MSATRLGPEGKAAAVLRRAVSGGGMTALGRIGRTAAGLMLVVLGVILIPLPGPGLLVVLAGLIVLAKDYAWAARLTDRVRRRADRAALAAQRWLRRAPRRTSSTPKEDRGWMS